MKTKTTTLNGPASLNPLRLVAASEGQAHPPRPPEQRPPCPRVNPK